MKGHFLNRIKLEFDQAKKLAALIYTDTMEEAEALAEYSGVTCEISEVDSSSPLVEGTNTQFIVRWYSTDAIDLLSNLNAGYGAFEYALGPISPTGLTCNFVKTCRSAVPPTRSHPSDSGFDVTIIAPVKTVGDVTFYTTGIQVDPPHGYYFDLVARSSLSKTGYMLANAVGIIDQSYRGDVIVPLRKLSTDAAALELPMRVAQLIPRQWYNMSMNQTYSLDSTARGDGGFGSTN